MIESLVALFETATPHEMIKWSACFLWQAVRRQNRSYLLQCRMVL